DIATQQIFDGISSRVNALWTGAGGLTLSGPNGAVSHVDTDSPVSFYVSGGFGAGNRGDHDTETGFHYTHGSVQGGADIRAGEHAAIGLQAGFGTTGATLKDGMGNDDLRTYSVAVYGALLDENWYGSLSGFYAYQDYDKLNRNTYVAGQVAQGTTNGTSVGFKLEGGYMFHEGSVTYGPTAELRYAHIDINAYTESGAVALNQEVDNQGFKSVVGQIGVQASTVFETDGVVWRPTLRANWDHQFSPNVRDVLSRLASLPQATIDTVVARYGQNWARLGGGVNVQASQSISVVAEADGNAGHTDAQDVSGMVRILYKF
ncbi:MAG: autotransporter outer membrane beta-barrel domain-containing protein, partial [Burkholderiales bacterium]|nr:autotransporter outer membrane beta-barrel domain-containing protein [Burkholderiales bacterium]